MMTSSTPIKPFSSFEEWQQRIDTRQRPRSPKVVGQQVIDSIDGGLSDDLGAMFENILSHQKPNNVYEKQQYISPIGNKPKKQEDNLKYLKERFNYASVDCAATVRKANKEAKGAQSILFESKDQYLLNRCLANKFVIINLCEQIRVDTIVMANFEFFSSTFKDFKVYGSAKYPSDDWWLLGQWQARNTRDLQVFRVPESPWTNYIKIEFLTHYGHEYYCPLSLVRVHGMSMMELYTNIESNDDESPTPEHLWPAEIREQIIQPQYDIVNSSESFPIKVEEEDVPIVIPPVVNDTEEMPTEEQMEMPEENIEKIEKTVTTSAVMTLSGESTCAQRNTIMPLPVNKPSQELIEQPSMIDSNDRNHELNMTSMGSPVTNTVSHTSTQETSTSNLTEDNRPMITQHKIHHSKETTQESIYKTIMKRLSVLEHNMTLSQRFLDEQNKVLNDVFLEMERKHQEQLIVLIEHLNGTASQKIETMASE
ncbi:hypothetical protein G6F57_006932 [Rhizopus arrhizus]|uniref:SUN-like protein 1 n=1 Tax=Rhizopus oryzae TaxID=64495 RepID=A0A9P6WZX1_RHIOR|nr:hypothetical protein G6F23_008670 [Rhizopus arrhizus]KAG1401449.1 hypothetical protein G6F58_010740 [Rhizopus delemar]KAG0765034.1 hypothetical protein G6F24_004744 [Rhizopus arrhizus]KAG0781544.1 hypothetical protein G6F21_011596 [Rhizopus arrhizus]KAG0783097.1 hypothetical protein G6F22_008828 [Rhizopus arrhizus]